MSPDGEHPQKAPCFFSQLGLVRISAASSGPMSGPMLPPTFVVPIGLQGLFHHIGLESTPQLIHMLPGSGGVKRKDTGDTPEEPIPNGEGSCSRILLALLPGLLAFPANSQEQ